MKRAIQPFHFHGVVAVLLSCTVLLMSVPGFAGTQVDPGKVKVKVERLGVGEHVMVRQLGGLTLHGHITGIEQDGFKIHPDKAESEVLIAYDQVVKIRKNPGPATWMLLGAVLVIVAIVAATR